MASADYTIGPSNRNLNVGYVHDLGWLGTTDSRVLTVGDDSKDYAGGAAVLLACDVGTLARNDAPVALRLRHPGSDAGGDRWWYASYRYRSLQSPFGVTINDVPLNAATAGKSRLLDTTAMTAAQSDAGVSVNQAIVLPALEGDFLLETVAATKAPATSTNVLDSALSLRVAKVDATTRLTGAALGCAGIACQPPPTATPLSLSCISSPAAAQSVSVPVTELGYPSVFSVSDPSVSSSSNVALPRA